MLKKWGPASDLTSKFGIINSVNEMNSDKYEMFNEISNKYVVYWCPIAAATTPKIEDEFYIL